MENKEFNFKERLIKSKEVFRGKLLKLTVSEVKLPDKNVTEREVVSHPGAVAIVPMTSHNEVVMVRQYRFAIERHTLELPAGTLEEGEKPIICAKREFEEEVKMRAKKWKKLISVYPSPGYCNEKIHIFLAKELEDLTEAGNKGENFKDVQNNIKNIRKSQVEVRKSEKDEFINRVIIPLEEAKNKIFSGEIIDAKTIIGIMLASLKHHKK
ncbi:MAG: NUDIX hydrolase [Actinobacteria bacterium]|nr:NUDIX hydrolase [Actinomycetota bacterium]